jgi:hypothetical protein
MPVNYLLKYLLTDKESLSKYSMGIFPNYEDVRRRMFLIARDQNKALPDHFYRLAQENTFNKLGSLGKIVTHGLMDLASANLELENTKIYIQSNKQNDWQELITHIPPLLLQSAFLYKKLTSNFQLDNVVSYYNQYIFPNTKFSALPSSRILQLDHYVNEQNGLHDLHMHLNGALETDQVWQDYLVNPSLIHPDLAKAFTAQKVKEQLEQESHLLEPANYISLLKAAQKLRSFFYDYLFPTVLADKKNTTKQTLIKSFLSDHSHYPSSYRHPFLSLLPAGDSDKHLMSIECMMNILILHEINTHKNETFAHFFHFYILILGLTNRLLVQQVHQKGFEQFQKHTLNGLREKSEKIYLKRFFQMHGNDSRNIRFLEGRFTPKTSEAELISSIDGIWKGWEKMKNEIAKSEKEGKRTFLNPELKLIAHFIKKEDKKPDLFIRHKSLRFEVWNKGRVLSLLIANQKKYRDKVVAVDAAASEFDAPPEVFAPIFRFMRRSGLKHFTYHAGEDFYHVISGIRAIYEAIVFCGLQKGDRIGHATASAISVNLWLNSVGSKILIRQGEYLDNLVFVYHLIIECKIDSLHSLIPFITNKVHNLSYEIYNEHYPIAILEKAWLMRQCCPIHAFEENRTHAALLNVFNEQEWTFMIDTGFIEDRNAGKVNTVWTVFNKYHDNEFRKKFDKIVIIDTLEIINADNIEVLQLGLLAYMNNREIIIETLPTSNVRIGFHRSFKTYHLWNWIKWRKEGKPIPPIIIGSDDTGIFATNIYNEYANIYCFLLNDCKQSHSEVMEVIKKLDEDSHIYRFE